MVLNGNHKGEKCLIKENHCLSSDENTADFWKKYEADLAECQETKVVHMGDIGCMMDDVSKLKNCDVLMIPIGGYYTIDTKEALKYIERIQPRIVIPMHYHSHEFGYDVLSTNEEFIQQSSSVTYVDDCLEVNKDTKTQTVVFKKPRN